MKIPISAIITEEKVREYLLTPRKRTDKSKWLVHAGYNSDNWKRLLEDIRTQILPLDAIYKEETKYGKIYEIKGPLVGPNGKILYTSSIWMNEKESNLIKFITMFPDKNETGQ